MMVETKWLVHGIFVSDSMGGALHLDKGAKSQKVQDCGGALPLKKE